MARIEGAQNIPSEWLDLYRATLTEKLPTGAARKRFPFRLRLFQKNGYKVSTAQLGQRSRFEAIRDKFKNVPWEVRQRWYAARPPWSSLLWYYNYFMLSGLMGNAVVGDKGGGVIKDINHYTYALPAGATPRATINVNTCDPAKSVPFFFGAGILEFVPGALVAVYPFLVSLNSTQMIIGASQQIDVNSEQSVTLIEYI